MAQRTTYGTIRNEIVHNVDVVSNEINAENVEILVQDDDGADYDIIDLEMVNGVLTIIIEPPEL